MATAALEPCQKCPEDTPCSTFDPDTDMGFNNICICGHEQGEHQTPRRHFAPRGGLPMRNCLQFTSVNGIAITDARQLCTCGGRYISHLPAAAAATRPSLSQAPPVLAPLAFNQTFGHLPAGTSSQTYPAPRSTFNVPSQLPPISQSASTMPSLTPYVPLSQSAPAPSQFQMPSLMPYVPRFPTSSPRSVFGEPVAIPSVPNRGRRTRTSRNGPPAPTGHRQRDNSLKFEMVLLPKDISHDYPSQDQHGLEGPDSIRIGEDLDDDLKFMRDHGLTIEVELRTTSSSQSVLPQILDHFQTMLQNGPFAYPPIPEAATSRALASTASDREERNLFNSLPFNFVRVGNSSTKRSTNGLSINKGLTYQSFGFKVFKDQFRRRISIQHPSNNQLIGIVFICPKAGRQLVGPINDNKEELHGCYSDFIISGFMQGRFKPPPGSDVSPDQGIEEWKMAYPYSCRNTCPGVVSSQAVVEESDNTLSEELRGNTRLATTMSVESTTLSPLLGDLELDFPPLRLPSPTHAPSSTITQPASQPNRVFIMPDRPTISNFTSYISPNIVPFQSLRIFAEHITEKRTSLAGRDDGSLFVSGSTVLEAAQALILVIKGTGRNQTTLFESELVWGGQGSKLSLSNLFQHSSWIFNAGAPTAEDAIGDGVMREVLLAAVHSFLDPTVGILDDLSNDDGFFGLKVSAEPFVSENTLDNAFTLGALCAIFMVKCHMPPDRVSPALLQAAIGGVKSIVDEDWIRATHEEVAKVLTLLPADKDVAIPNDRLLRRLFESRMPGCRFGDICNSRPDQREQLRCSLYINTLLGNTEYVFTQSSEFAAFRKGFDLYLIPEMPSFVEAIKTSSKYLLATCSSAPITSAFQLIDRLQFSVSSNNETFLRSMNRVQVEKIKRAISRYLLGEGHPYPDRVAGLMNKDILDDEQHDPLFRTRRFIKVTSGLTTIPSDNREFMIVLTDTIPDLLRIYWDEGRIAPPASHACFFRLDVFVNEAFLKALDDSNVPLGQDTEFDWGMHMGMMMIGQSDEFNG